MASSAEFNVRIHADKFPRLTLVLITDGVEVFTRDSFYDVAIPNFETTVTDALRKAVNKVLKERKTNGAS